MRAVLQRVIRASVSVDGETVGRIEGGLLVLVGAAHGDTVEGAQRLARKAAELRIFPSLSLRAGSPRPSGFERSLVEAGGAALVVSQFTLLSDVRKGRRPSFVEAERVTGSERRLRAAGLQDRGMIASRRGASGRTWRWSW